MPEVSLVAILDADKEGFLRSDRSLIQTIGRAARNVNGKAILYGDRITGSMQRAIEETDRRREKQIAFNEEHGITPQKLNKKVTDVMDLGQGGANRKNRAAKAVAEVASGYDPRTVMIKDTNAVIKEISKEKKCMKRLKTLSLRRRHSYVTISKRYVNNLNEQVNRFYN